jgi:3-oxoacyl-[acyl-carrier protein] reductase
MKVAIITGASRGIGKATAVLLSEKGYCVVLCGRDLLKLQQVQSHLKGPSLIVEGDIICQKTQEKIIHDTLQTFRQIDILINNAGANFYEGSILEVKEKHIERTFQLNYTSVLQMCQKCIPVMISQQKGTIVNVSSVSSYFPDPTSAVYASSKAALETLTKSLAIEFAGKGIRVNCVSPGYTDTGMTEDMDCNIQQKKCSVISLKRFGKDTEIANAIVFLAEDHSSFCNGTILKVNGGYLLGL